MEALELLGISGPMVVLQAVPFFLVLVGLNHLIFRPTLELLARREQRITGVSQAAGEQTEAVANQASQLDERLAATKAQANADRAEVRARAEAQAAAILGEARGKADVIIDAARAELDVEVAAARKALHGTAVTLSQQIASAVLGREVKGS